MKIISSFKNLEHTESLDFKIEEKSQKLKKFFDGQFEVHWTCFIDDYKKQCVDLKVIGPSFEYHASAGSEKLYKTFDLALAKIERQIGKKKDKWKNHISRKHKNSFKDHQLAQQEWDEEFWQDRLHDDLAS